MKRKLASVLWDAANKYLASDTISAKPPYEFSCTAVVCSLADGEAFHLSMRAAYPAVDKFLSELGCDTNSWSCFKRFREGTDRQGVRYMWLLLAMHVAEEEGIEIEDAA